MRRRQSVFLATAAGLLTAAIFSGATLSLDLHWFWDQRCISCHGHAAQFARARLRVEDGKLIGQHHKSDLLRFIAQHENGGEHAVKLYDMLLAQATTSPIFQQKCAGCHRSAAEFARNALTVVDGKIAGKANKKPIAEFLKTHGRLTEQELPVILESLGRIMGEIGMPSVQ